MEKINKDMLKLDNSQILNKVKLFKHGKPLCMKVVPEKFIFLGMNNHKIAIYNYD